MNARQKAKKYKRMYEALLAQSVEFKVEQHKIDTLRFERFYPEELATLDYCRETIFRDIAQCLASNLDKYLNYYTEFCPHVGQYRFYGEINLEQIERKYAEPQESEDKE